MKSNTPFRARCACLLLNVMALQGGGYPETTAGGQQGRNRLCLPTLTAPARLAPTHDAIS